MNYIFFAIVILSSFITPLLSALCINIIFLTGKKTININFIILTNCILLTVINSTKILSGDLILYDTQYNTAQYLSYVDYLLFSNKDPLFYTYMYLSHSTFGISFEGFIIMSTLVSYYSLLWGGVIFNRVLGGDKSNALFIITFLSFFSPLFSISCHLLRQFLAMSIGYLLLALIIEKHNNKFKLILITLTTLIHTSNLLFVIGSIFNLMIKKKRNIIIFSFLAIVLVALSDLIFSTNSVFLNAFLRLKNLNSGSDLDSLSIFVNILFFIIFLCHCYSLNRYRKLKHKFNKRYTTTFVIFFLFIIYIISLIFGSNELQIRGLFFMYLLFPISFVIFMTFFPSMKLVTYSITILIVILFLSHFYFSPWEYNNTLNKVLLNS